MILDFLFKRKKKEQAQTTKEKTPSKIEIETMMVNRITTDDMLQFAMIPYDLTCPVKKHIAAGSHPFAYMDINHANEIVAKEELMKISEYILQAYEYIPEIAFKAVLHAGRVVFKKYSENYGYTRLICTPYTQTGKISKNPVSLNFMTRADNYEYQANGVLKYGVDGNVMSADVHIAKNIHQPNYESWAFKFKTIGRTLVIYEVKVADGRNLHEKPRTIYRFTSS